MPRRRLIEEKFQKLLGLELSPRDRSFIESLHRYYQGKGTLTSGRRYHLGQMENKYSAEEVQKRAEKIESCVVRGKLQEMVDGNLPVALSDFDKKAVFSLHEKLHDRGDLSEKQIKLAEKIWDRYQPEALEAADEWASEYRTNFKEVAIEVARYYSGSGYFQGLSTKILDNPDYVPVERVLRKMIDNKYAEKVIRAYKEDPIYPVGSIVVPRQRKISSPTFYLILRTNAAAIRSACKGAKMYEVLVIEKNQKIFIEERRLKWAKGQRPKKSA